MLGLLTQTEVNEESDQVRNVVQVRHLATSFVPRSAT